MWTPEAFEVTVACQPYVSPTSAQEIRSASGGPRPLSAGLRVPCDWKPSFSGSGDQKELSSPPYVEEGKLVGLGPTDEGILADMFEIDRVTAVGKSELHVVGFSSP